MASFVILSVSEESGPSTAERQFQSVARCFTSFSMTKPGSDLHKTWSHTNIGVGDFSIFLLPAFAL